MQANQINVARVIKMAMFGSVLLIAGIIGATKAHAQVDQLIGQIAGQIIGNVVVAGVDGVSCAAAASIHQAGRGRDGYRGQRAMDYTQCANRANMDRQMMVQQQRAMAQQEYYRQRAMQERAYYQYQAEAPRCQYYEQNGRQFRNCSETVHGPWR